MSLRAAIAGLRTALGPYTQTAACATCGAPADRWRTSCILLPGEEPTQCPACAHPTDTEGRAVGVPTPRGIYAAYLCTDDCPPPAHA